MPPAGAGLVVAHLTARPAWAGTSLARSLGARSSQAVLSRGLQPLGRLALPARSKPAETASAPGCCVVYTFPQAPAFSGLLLREFFCCLRKSFFGRRRGIALFDYNRQAHKGRMRKSAELQPPDCDCRKMLNVVYTFFEHPSAGIIPVTYILLDKKPFTHF